MVPRGRKLQRAGSLRREANFNPCWTADLCSETIVVMRIASISERNRLSRSGRVHHCDICSRRRAARLRRLVLVVIGVCLGSCVLLRAQTSASQTSDADKSWRVTSESQGNNVNPTRTAESHSVNGNRTVDNQSIQRRVLTEISKLIRTSKKQPCRLMLRRFEPQRAPSVAMPMERKRWCR